MPESYQPPITEINFIPCRPQNGLIGHCSFVYREELHIGNVAVFTRFHPQEHSPYRLAYPEGPLKKSLVYPINKKTQQEIERIVGRFIEDLLSRHANDRQGGNHA